MVRKIKKWDVQCGMIAKTTLSKSVVIRIMENELYVAPTVHRQEIGHRGESNMEREEAKPCVEIILWIRSAT